MELKINTIEDMKTFITLAIEEEKSLMTGMKGKAIGEVFTKLTDGDIDEFNRINNKHVVALDERAKDIIKFAEKFNELSIYNLVAGIGASTGFVVVSTGDPKDKTKENVEKMQDILLDACSMMRALDSLLRFAHKKGYAFKPGQYQTLSELIDSSSMKFSLAGLALARV